MNDAPGNESSDWLNVLLVEDSPDDCFFFEYELKQTEVLVRLSKAADGIEAIDLLERQRSNPEGSGLPELIFLDLKMPGCDGFDVLRWMNQHSLLQATKVFVLSGSSEPKDVSLARELGALDYLVKPVRAQALKKLLSFKKSSGEIDR